MKKPEKTTHAVRGTLLYMKDRQTSVCHLDGGVVWNDHGQILDCNDWSQIAAQWGDNMPCDDWRGQLIIPGFVDCHVHLPQLDCRNKNGVTLLDWLKKYIYPAEANFADPIFARNVAKRFYAELLQNGTTTAMIHCSIHEGATHIAFEEAERSGIRAIIGKVMMDQNCPESLKERTVDSLRATEKLIDRWHGKNNRLHYAVTPRFALTCGRELMRDAGKMALAADCYFQTHLAETQEEVAQAHRIHETKDYVGLWADCQCLGPKSLYAHAIYLSDREWQHLAMTQTAVAHCPSSNIFLQSGRMPVEQVRKHNVRLGLGSDVGAGPEFSLWDVIRCALHQHTADTFSAIEGFYHATLGGARAVGMEATIGSFEPGKSADLAVFPLPPHDAVPEKMIAGQLQHKPSSATAVYIVGQRLNLL